MQSLMNVVLVAVIVSVATAAAPAKSGWGKSAGAVAKEEPKFKRGTQDLSASVKNVGVDGIDGLNVKWEAPFKFDEWVVGFKLALSDLRRAPETLFVKRTYDTPVVDGAATVDCSYNVASKVLSTDCTWVSKTSDLAVSVSGNTEDKLTKVGAAGSVRIAGEKLALEATRDLKNAKYSGSARVAHGDTSITVSYDSEENDPLLKVNHKLDNLNSVTPKISLKSGAASYGWTRALNGGSVETIYSPGDDAVVDVVWKDKGMNGFWTAKASIPVDDHSKTKLSLSREWDY